jgi:hypothetical protein
VGAGLTRQLKLVLCASHIVLVQCKMITSRALLNYLSQISVFDFPRWVQESPRAARTLLHFSQILFRFTDLP